MKHLPAEFPKYNNIVEPAAIAAMPCFSYKPYIFIFA
jgi:hypothetical protein